MDIFGSFAYVGEGFHDQDVTTAVYSMTCQLSGTMRIDRACLAIVRKGWGHGAIRRLVRHNGPKFGAPAAREALKLRKPITVLYQRIMDPAGVPEQ